MAVPADKQADYRQSGPPGFGSLTFRSRLLFFLRWMSGIGRQAPKPMTLACERSSGKADSRRENTKPFRPPSENSHSLNIENSTAEPIFHALVQYLGNTGNTVAMTLEAVIRGACPVTRNVALARR